MSGKYELLEPNVHRGRRALRLGLYTLIGTFALSAVFLRRADFTLFTSDAADVATGSSTETLKQCGSPEPLQVTPPAPLNVWASLSISETARIQSWLESPDRELNLTRAVSSTVSDNVIFLIEAYYPPKAAVLAYLDSPATVSPPERYSRVTVHHGADTKPVIKDYLVGPLPIGPHTTMKQLTEIYHRADIPHNARGYATATELSRLLSTIAPPLEEAMLVRTFLDFIEFSC